VKKRVLGLGLDLWMFLDILFQLIDEILKILVYGAIQDPSRN
jgi:hypothetical protein